MYERKKYLKRAFYHIMKMQMSKNKLLAYEGYRRDNEKLGRAFAKGETFDNSIIFVKNGKLNLTPKFFKLKSIEQDALIDFMCRNNDGGLSERPYCKCYRKAGG